MRRSPTSEECLFAALAHIGIIANGFNLLGIIGAVLIWATQRKHSRYVADHALQALMFQVLVLLLVGALLLTWGGVLVLSFLPAVFRPDLYAADPPIAFRLTLLMGLMLLALVVVFAVLYGLLGAFAAWRGHPFRYALVEQVIALRNSESKEQCSAGLVHAPPGETAAE